MYKLNFTPRFHRAYKRLIKRDKALENTIDSVLITLAADPRNPRIRSHKVLDREGNVAFSSEVTGDLRIIWVYGEQQNTLVLLDFGGHSGSKKVYR